MGVAAWQARVHEAILESLVREAETAESLREALGYANTGAIYGLRKGKGEVSAGRLVRLIHRTTDRRLRSDLLGLLGAVAERGPAVSVGLDGAGVAARSAIGTLAAVLEYLAAASGRDTASGRREALGQAFSETGVVQERLEAVRAAINEATARELSRRAARPSGSGVPA